MNIGEYTFNESYLYDKEHNWVQIDGDTATVGVTDFFQKTANEIVFIEVPLVGRSVEKGSPYSSIESGKWVGRLKAPLTGKIVAVNSELADFPYLLNESPYAEGWIVKIQFSNPVEASELFDLNNAAQAAAFQEFIAAEHQRITGAKGQ